MTRHGNEHLPGEFPGISDVPQMASDIAVPQSAAPADCQSPTAHSLRRARQRAGRGGSGTATILVVHRQQEWASTSEHGDAGAPMQSGGKQRYVPGGAPFSFLCGIDEVRLRVRRSGSLLCLRPCSKSCFVEEKRNGRATCAGVLAGLAARGVEDM